MRSSLPRSPQSLGCYCLIALLTVSLTGVEKTAVASETIYLSDNGSNDQTTIRVMEKTSTGITVELAVPFVIKEDLEVAGRPYQMLTFPEGQLHGAADEAALPTITRLVVVPRGATARVALTSSERTVLPGMDIAPLRDAPGDNLDRELGGGRRSAPAQQATVELGPPALIRDVQVVPITFRPLRYDADSGEVEVTHRMTAQVVFSGGEPDRPSDRLLPRSFAGLLETQALNFDGRNVHSGPGTYLMILADGHEPARAALAPLVEWRQRQGYNVVLKPASEIGNATANILNYILTAYETWEIPLEYVVLVGEGMGSPRVVAWRETLSGFNGEGDHYYSMLSGDDVLSDVFIGRLSYENNDQLEDIVDKIVAYETNPPLSDWQWFERACLAADPSTSGESCITITQWVKNQLLAEGYSDIDTIWSGNFASQMYSGINQGATVATYRGLGGTSGFSNGHVSSLSNGNELPLAVFITCDTGSFANSNYDAMTEYFLRNGHGGAAGAIGMATIGTHTRYNNCLFAGIFEGALVSGDHRFGNALAYGKLNMYANYAVSEPNIVEIWSVWCNLMGDPATDMWTNFPTALTVDHPAQLPVGVSSVFLTVEEAGGGALVDARVSLFKEDEILAVGHTDADGVCMLEIPDHTGGELLVTVTHHNRLPYRGSLTLGSLGDYLDVAQHSIDDDGAGASAGNGDGLVNPGETIELNVNLANRGSATAYSVSATLSSDDPYVTVLDGAATFSDITAGGSAWCEQPFLVSLAADAPDGHALSFVVAATSNAGTWPSLVPVVVHGTAYEATGFSFGGPDGTLDPDEAGTFSIVVANNGSVVQPGATATLVSNSPWVTVTDSGGTYGTIPIGGDDENTGDPFAIAVSPFCYPGHQASFSIRFDFADGAEETVLFSAQVGVVAVTDPLGPDAYGYYAFDNGDAEHTLAPRYEWIEIDPDYGGPGTTLDLTDFGVYQDETVTVDLPFTFSFYGQQHDTISICSNGWLAMGATYLTNYRNWSLPCPGFPDALIAVFWDSLYLEEHDSDVLMWYDEENHRLVIEWSRVLQSTSGETQTFEVILHDPAFYDPGTGDGIITCQYLEINPYNDQLGYFTVGLQNHDHSDGLLYTYANHYPAGAAAVQNGRAITFLPVLPANLGTLQGEVTNASAGGAPVENATVAILGTGRRMFTTADGTYEGNVQTGTWDVAVYHESFAPDTLVGVEINAGETTEVAFALVDVVGPAISGTTALGNTEDTTGPYVVETTILDQTGIAETHLYYTSSSHGGPFAVPLEVIDAQTGQMRAEIPGQPTATRIQYWITAVDVVGNQSSDPVNAPWGHYAFFIISDLSAPVFSDDMESDNGWTVGQPGDDANSGIWERVDPNGVWENGYEVQPEDDHTPSPGTYCWITGNDPPGSAQGVDDVDGGVTTLLSPWIDVSAHAGVSCSYVRWYTNNTGDNPNSDFWVVQVTANGSDWFDLENTYGTYRAWLERSFVLADYLELNGSLRFRFQASDEGGGSIVEAGIDDFAVTGYASISDGAPPQVTLTAPNGGEVIPGGGASNYTITWNAVDDIGVVETRIVLSRDSGVSWDDTLSVGPHNNSWTWTVPAENSTTCRIKVLCFDALQNMASDASDADFAIDAETAIAETTVPAVLSLAQNHPNPFNPRTTIRFGLPDAQEISLRIYDIYGRLVTTLADGEFPAGLHELSWQGADGRGRPVASGTYFYRLTGARRTETRKMLLLK